MKKDFLIFTDSILTIALAACAAKGYVAPTTSANPAESGSNQNSAEQNPATNLDKTPEQKQQETLDSFVKAHPEYEGREMFSINVLLPLKGTEANTVVMKSNASEKIEIDSYKYSFNGIKLQPYDEAVVYTEKTDFDGKTEWVRLAGVWFPTEDGSVNTAWYSSSDAFNKDKVEVNFNRKVFGFNSSDTNFAYWPLFDKPYTLDWASDLSSRNVADYSPWDGLEPYTLSMGTISPQLGKALFAPKPDEKTVEVQAPAAETDLRPAYTETVAGQLLGVNIITKLITDESLDPTITAIKINPHFSNSEGKTSEEALIEFTAKTFYKVWLKKGGPDGTGPKADVSFEEYMTLWAKAQSPDATDEDKSNAEITIDLTNGEKKSFVPMQSDGITELNINFVKTNKMDSKNINKIPNISGDPGLGIVINGSSLNIYLGLAIDGASKTANQTTTQMANISSWMISQSIGAGSAELKKIINTKHGPSAIQIFAQGVQTEDDRSSNP